MRMLCIAVSLLPLVAGSAKVETEMPVRLSVESIGTPLDIPEIWGGPQRQYVAVSPDGNWIAYTWSGFPPEHVLYLKSLVDGTERIAYVYNQFADQLKDDPTYPGNDPRYTNSSANAINSVAFTPDSREITFEVAIYDSAFGSAWTVKRDAQGRYSGIAGSGIVPFIKSYVIETGEVRDIAKGSRMSWDPAGRYLLFTDWEPPDIPAQGTVLLDTWTGEKHAVEHRGTFTSDYRSLVYCEPAPDAPATFRLYRAPFSAESRNCSLPLMA